MKEKRIAEFAIQEAKERLIYSLINWKKEDKEKLKEMVYLPLYGDIGAILSLLLRKEEHGLVTARLTRKQAEYLEIGEEQLWHWARINTPKLLPVKLSRMEDVLKELEEALQGSCCMAEEKPAEAAPECGEGRPDSGVQLYILSNVLRIRGAAAILYPGVLKMAAKQIGGDLLVIPSSIHEMILLKWDESKGIDLEEVKQMVYEINRQNVLPEEVLSDTVYCYSSSEDRLYKPE